MAVFFVPGGAATITGTAGDDIFFATADQLSTGLRLDGAEGRDRLVLVGTGTFDLRAPAAFSSIEVVEAQERTEVNRQIIHLRDGTALSVEVIGTASPSDPDLKGVVIYGAANADTIRLGPGFDTVTLGSGGETVLGGSGRSEIVADPAFLDAKIAGGTRGANLTLTRPDVAVMGGKITNLASVTLTKEEFGPTYDFTANATPGLTVRGTQGDTLRAGGPNQTLVPGLNFLGRGSSVLYGDAAGTTTFRNPFGGEFGPAQIYGLAAGSAIDTDDAPAKVRIEVDNGVMRYNAGFFIPQYGDYYVRVEDAGTTPELFPGGFVVSSNGHGGTRIVYDPRTAAGIAPAGVFGLTAGVDAVAGTGAAEAIVARAGTLSAGDTIDAGGGRDVLWLDGRGSFDLRKPAALTGIEVVSLREGGSGNRQEVWLRDGTALTVEVRGSLDNFGESFRNGVTIHGGRNADTIKLGAGYDVVELRDVRTTVIGGEGSMAVFADARLLSATVSGGKGGGTLFVTGGGSAVMGTGFTRMQAVVLTPGGTPYDFTSNTISGLTIQGTGGHETIRAGGLNQVITSGGGGDRLIGSAAGYTTFRNGFLQFNGATIENFGTAGSVIDVTDMRPDDLSIGYDDGVLSLLRFGQESRINLTGSFAASGFHLADDGRGGSRITYAAPAMAALMDAAALREASPLEHGAAAGPVPGSESSQKTLLGLAAPA